MEHRAETALQHPQLQLTDPSSHSTMKVLAATVLALLLVASCSPVRAHLDAVPTSCCFTYHQRPIPRGLIASVYVTSSSCAHPGVIVVTKKKKQLCVDPREPWVQERLKQFQTPPN